MPKIFPLKGQIQNYAWGGQQFIPDLLGLTSEDGPYAEYWLGAHANSPSRVIHNSEEVNLDQFINENIEKTLGERVASEFGRLPFLFKVLDVKDMLSIQVHPSKKEAEKGFARENDEGIALDAANRNYKDDNHKPEIMVALSEFWLLHGFLPREQMTEILTTTPELNFLIDIFQQEGYFGLYKSVMLQSDEERSKRLQPLLSRILPLYHAGKLDKSSPDYWAAKAAITFENEVPDRGIYSIYFSNIVRLETGQAIFQDAGVPHAYLEGQNMELMANSDNVLRGGLTPKHVDVDELLKHVIFKETYPEIMSGEVQPDRLEKIYKSPAPDFELSKIDLNSQDVYQANSSTVAIIMVLSGEVLLKEGIEKIGLTRGEAAFIVANSDYKIECIDPTTIFKAAVP
ncbi:MAG: mannose-6-phosphate isomerase, class I [Reichenbachiella sp.]|uniref:mannose-6-phosphate isomerase, class I n=1 Tax=Reichenbachiella sp. TaxID=2184521 RepID=UPI003266E8EE